MVPLGHQALSAAVLHAVQCLSMGAPCQQVRMQFAQPPTSHWAACNSEHRCCASSTKKHGRFTRLCLMCPPPDIPAQGSTVCKARQQVVTARQGSPGSPVGQRLRKGLQAVGYVIAEVVPHRGALAVAHHLKNPGEAWRAHWTNCSHRADCTCCRQKGTPEGCSAAASTCVKKLHRAGACVGSSTASCALLSVAMNRQRSAKSMMHAGSACVCQ